MGSSSSAGDRHSGTGHWIAERASAAALLPLTGWFAVQMLRLSGADYDEAVEQNGRPGHAAMLMLLIGTTFYHAEGGLQVIADDYVHGAARKPVRIAIRAGMAGLALTGLVSVLRVAGLRRRLTS